MNWGVSIRSDEAVWMGALCLVSERYVNDILIDKRGRLAQLVRAAALHAVGQGFESLVAHS